MSKRQTHRPTGFTLAMFDNKPQRWVSPSGHYGPGYDPMPTGHIIVGNFSGRCCRCDGIGGNGWIRSSYSINVAGPDDSPVYRVICEPCYGGHLAWVNQTSGIPPLHLTSNEARRWKNSYDATRFAAR
jgi:hypothetical protein